MVPVEIMTVRQKLAAELARNLHEKSDLHHSLSRSRLAFSSIALSEITTLPSGHLPVLHPSLRLWQAEGIHPVRPKGVAGGDVNGTAHDGGLRSKVVIERMPVGIDDRPQEGSSRPDQLF